MNAELAHLTEVNIDDVLSAWGLANVRFGRRLLRWLARPPSVRFARDILLFDELTGKNGLTQASSALARKHTGGVQANGLEHIPAEGPLMILSNHPGLADTVSLFACISRPDLKAIALDRPFLRSLPHVSEQLFLLPDDLNARAGLTRTAANHLRKGGCLATFPAGHIEPDPLVQTGAMESLESWSESIAFFARLAPATRIVVAVVGGVFTAEALRNPLTRLRRQPKDRELLAAALQVAWAPYKHNLVSIVFAPALLAAELTRLSNEPAAITRRITDEARRVLEHWPQDWQRVV